MAKPTISVIVPIYNVAAYLEECVASLLGQTYKNLQIILIDDGSTDDSSAICDALQAKDSRVQVAHQKNNGVSHARNVGIEMASGDYLTFVDGDDIVAPDMIAVLYETLHQHKADASVCGVSQFTDATGPVVADQEPTTRVITGEEAIEDMLYEHTIVNGPAAKLYKKSLFAGVRFPEGVAIGEDLYTNYKLFAKAKHVAASSAQKYFYRVRLGSAIHSSFSIKRMESLALVRKMLEEVNRDQPAIAKAAENRLFMEAVYTIIEIPYGARHLRQERIICLQALRAFGGSVRRDKAAKSMHRQYAHISAVSPRLLVLRLKLQRAASPAIIRLKTYIKRSEQI